MKKHYVSCERVKKHLMVVFMKIIVESRLQTQKYYYV